MLLTVLAGVLRFTDLGLQSLWVEIRLGVIHRADTLGAPQVNVLLDPGRNAG